MCGIAALVVLAVPGLAEVSWPIECDDASAWEAQPSWVGNPAERATVGASDGAVSFTVDEPARGMKWTLPVQGLSVDLPGYVLVRCRAENLKTGGPYVLWAISGDADGAIISAGDFPVDGEWHEVAVDMLAAGRRGRVHTLAVEVQAGDALPAQLSFDFLRVVMAPPEGAIVLPEHATETREWREEFDGALVFRAQPDWLGNPASAGSADLTQADGRLVLQVTEAGKGMKWSARLEEPVDLTEMTYFTIRYRATGAVSWGDYFVWAGSEAGGRPQESATLIGGTEVRSDGRWHTETLSLEERFPVVELAVQLQAGSVEAVAEIDYLAFSSRRTLLPVEEALAFARGWDAAQLPEGSFTCVTPGPACNRRSEDLTPWFGLAGWLPGPRITVEGVPFELVPDGTDLAVIPAGSREPFAVPVGQEADELFLLLALRLPLQDHTDMLGGRPLRGFSAPERFRVAVDYADGVTDWHFPARVPDGAFEVCEGLAAYVLPGLRAGPIRQIRLWSAMPDAIIALAAVTAHRGEPLVDPEPVPVLPPPAEVRPIRETPPELRLSEHQLALGNAYLQATFSLDRGLRLESMVNHCLRGGEMTVAPGSVFTLAVGDLQVDSTQVTLGEVEQECTDDHMGVVIPVDAREAGVPLAGRLSLGLSRGPELEMSLELTHVGDEVIRPGILFPELRGLTLGSVEDTWYLDCARGGVISNRPTWSADAYSGRNPLQVMGAFNPSLGGGLYLMVHDLEDIYKYLVVSKDERGVLLRADTFARDYHPGEEIEIAPAVIGAHTGDWRAALEAYRGWTRTWYKPAAPRKQWFKECFNYRQHLVRGGLYDFGAREYRMGEALQRDIDFFGRVDYFHIFDFGQSDTYGRVGDYSHYNEIGGREKLAAAIRGVQETGARVGLYIEGYLVDERGEFGRDYVEPWHIIKADGEPLLWPGTPTEHMMCPAVEGWQDYLAGTYRRVESELHPDGMYIDQHGFADAWKICYSPDHGHPVPQPPLRGEREMDRKIRAAVPQEVATLTEEVPTDVNSQYQDGALGYSVAQANTRLAPHRIQLFRFCFPDVKVFQLVSYNPFIDGGWERLKFPFFNGEGTWLGNPIPSGFDADAQDFLRRSFALLHEHREAFTSDEVEPLVPTENPQVCANRFAGTRETVWTLLNVGFSTHRGPVLRVPHEEGATYRDLWRDEPLEPVIEDGWATLRTELGPREVGCVAQVAGARE